jgi:choline dehydrogenase-like flavoprotein
VKVVRDVACRERAESDCEGISPAWPISYEQKKPYYIKAEELYEAL